MFTWLKNIFTTKVTTWYLVKLDENKESKYSSKVLEFRTNNRVEASYFKTYKNRLIKQGYYEVGENTFNKLKENNNGK